MKYGKLPDVKETFELYKRTPHGFLEEKAKAKLRRIGYRIIARKHAPKWIKRTGSPDIIAEKNGEYILVEVKPRYQLKRYSKATANLILVTDVEEEEAVKMWGLKELET